VGAVLGAEEAHGDRKFYDDLRPNSKHIHPAAAMKMKNDMLASIEAVNTTTILPTKKPDSFAASRRSLVKVGGVLRSPADEIVFPILDRDYLLL
jgi:hypothetical protein